MVHISLVPALTPLYLYVSTSRSMCAVPNMAVFCSSLSSWFPGMLLTYFLNDSEIVPVAPIITGITFVLHSTRVVFLLTHMFSFHYHELLLLLLLILAYQFLGGGLLVSPDLKKRSKRFTSAFHE